MSSPWMIVFTASLKLCHRSRTEGTFRHEGGLLQQINDFYPLEYTQKEEISYETYEENDSFSIRIL
jgi:hypothetical protein